MIFSVLLQKLGRCLSRNTDNSGRLIYHCLTSCNIVCGYGVDEELALILS